MVGQRGDELGGPEACSRNGWASRSGAGLKPHVVSRPAQPGDQVVDHVGGERTGEAGLDVALGAVVEQCLGGGHLGGGVGQVVGHHLVHVGPAVGGQVAECPADDAVGDFDDLGGSTQVGSRRELCTRSVVIECRGYRRVGGHPETGTGYVARCMCDADACV